MSHAVTLQLQLGLPNQKINPDTGISQNTTRLDNRKKRQETMQEDIAAQMLASSLGIPFDIDKSWDEKRQQWTISGKIYKTSNVTQSTRGNKDGKWTTTFAAAVLVL